MFKTILVAIDGSDYGKAAVEYGANLAARLDSRLELLHIIDWRLLVGHFVSHFTEVFHHESGGSFIERVERYYREYAEHLVKQARERSISLGVSDCTGTVEKGNVVRQIISHADEADLLVIGQRGETEEHETGFLGSVAERVLHAARTTALVVQPPVREWRRALLAFDGTVPAVRAMDELGELAVRLNLAVDIAHLFEPHKDPASLKEAEEFFSRLPISYEVHYLEGDSHAVILQYALEKNCDLLAMGAFANGLYEELALGTTTEEMLRQSQIPVLVHH